MKQKFSVTGMTCSACSAHVDKAVRKLPGVKDVNVNLLGGSMTVEYEEQLSPETIIQAVTDSGYRASVPEAKQKAPDRPVSDMEEELRDMKKRFLVSLCFLVPLFYIAMGHMTGLPLPGFLHGGENALSFALIQFLLIIPILYVNDKYFKVGFRSLFKGAPNMDSLIAVGSAAAVIYGIAALFQIGYGLGHGEAERVSRYSMDLYFESAGMILTLITLGKYLETRSKGKTGEAISKLIDLTPKTATILRDGREVELSVEEVAVGDIILVRPGQSVPVDGEVVEGASALDESALTGESVPVDKSAGDRIIAASMNQSGSFTMRATRVGSDTTIAQMIALVEEAASSKAPIAKLADKVAGIFVPVVLAIALITALAWLLTGYSVEMALTSAVAVLVISCPCALGLATPVAIMVGTGKGAENGILIKSAETLETLHLVKAVVVDKTGTVTEGKPKVTGLYPISDMTEEELLRVAAALEKPSEHPLAQAIVTEADGHGMQLPLVTEFRAVHGRGVAGSIQDDRYLAGNLAFLQENSVDPSAISGMAEAISGEGKTPLYFAKNGSLIGMIAVADTVKPTSRGAIASLREMGLEVIMLTGDHSRTAEAIGRELALSKVVAEALPADKEQEITRLQSQGKKVAMIGDGINDAPALARADVGIAIGAGTDIAIESADIVLIKNDLMDVVAAIQLSKAVIRNVKQNLFWAFFYNIIGIPLAAGVFYAVLNWQLSPMFAAAAMSLSSVSVVSNALRLKLFQPKYTLVQESKIQNISKGETKIMEKKIVIEGMSCGHCSARVEKALNALPGVSATVDLASKTATVTGEASDEALKNAVTDAGYEVISIS